MLVSTYISDSREHSKKTTREFGLLQKRYEYMSVYRECICLCSKGTWALIIRKIRYQLTNLQLVMNIFGDFK